VHPPRTVARFGVTRTGHTLLDVRGLSVEFRVGRGRPPLRAVDDVSLDVNIRETVGLVGESGSGKSTIGRAILGLTPPQRGSITFGGREITSAGYRDRRELSADIQVVFQDPYGSLNPTRTVAQTLAEPLRVHGDLSRDELADRVRTMLGRVGLPSAAATRYPLHFSGGQRQRIAIARALMVQPKLVICDEPVSALDLSVQAQVLNLLRELQDDFQLAYLFISHDLAVVRHLSHRIIVLYHGRIMEEGSAAAVYDSPLHPYTQALLEAAPLPEPGAQRRRRVARTTRRPSASQRMDTEACVFAPRCPHATTICWTVRPHLEDAPDDRRVACHHWRELRIGPPRR
jgi:oligopeptide/dipeptide ABC transporter ATP-binding protein